MPVPWYPIQLLSPFVHNRNPPSHAAYYREEDTLIRPQQHQQQHQPLLPHLTPFIRHSLHPNPSNQRRPTHTLSSSQLLYNPKPLCTQLPPLPTLHLLSSSEEQQRSIKRLTGEAINKRLQVPDRVQQSLFRAAYTLRWARDRPTPVPEVSWRQPFSNTRVLSKSDSWFWIHFIIPLFAFFSPSSNFFFFFCLPTFDSLWCRFSFFHYSL